MAKSARKHEGCDDNTERPLIDLIKTILTEMVTEIRKVLTELQTKEKERNDKIMTALETLTDSVNKNTTGQAALTAAVNQAIIHIGTPGATDAQLLSLAAAIDQNTQSDADLTKALTDAVNPPAPTP